MNSASTTGRGFLIAHIIVAAAVATILLVGLIGWAAASLKAAQHSVYREQALHIAEAGVEYYRWHLAHAPSDFQDGTAGPGPYMHEYKDSAGNVIGEFSLVITPPPLGSTRVRIESTGRAYAASTTFRTVVVELAKPSIAKYAVVANDAMRFGAGTEVFGPIHSNQGIRFDGLAHDTVTSVVPSYDDPDHIGVAEHGVHTHKNIVATVAEPNPPASIPARPDVFRAGRQTGVPSVDFTGITADLATMRSAAQAGGFFRTSSGSRGYEVTLQTNDTFRLRRVTSLAATPSDCTPPSGVVDWGSWSIQNSSNIGTFALPANGLLFLEDNVWVRGQVDSARVTIIAATLPDSEPTRKSITINNNLRYTNYDGTDVIGLIAQKNINVGMNSEDDLRIDAALIAQYGRVGRYYYEDPDCTNHTRSSLTLWGMIGTNQRYGFAYTDGTGYTTRSLNYDGNLLYGPPPSFPLTTDQYQPLIWEER